MSQQRTNETINIDLDSDSEVDASVQALEKEAGIEELPSFNPNTVAVPFLKAVSFCDIHFCFKYRTNYSNPKAYIQSERNCAKLRDLLRKSELEHATLEAQIATTKQSSKAGFHPTMAKDQDRINQLGRKFSVLYEPWLGFQITKVHANFRPDVNPYSFTRSITSAANKDAMQAELIDFVPADLRKAMGFTGFSQIVSPPFNNITFFKEISTLVHPLYATPTSNHGSQCPKCDAIDLPRNSSSSRYLRTTSFGSRSGAIN